MIQATNVQYLPVLTQVLPILNSKEKENENLEDICYLKKGVFSFPYGSLDIPKQEYLKLAYYNITNMLYSYIVYDLEKNIDINFEKTEYNNICILSEDNKKICYLEIFQNEDAIQLYGNITNSFDTKEITLSMLKLIGINKLIGERSFRNLNIYENMRIDTEFVMIRLR